MNSRLPEDEQLDPDCISSSSMVSSQTGAPMVMLRWFTHIAQLDEAQARGLAFNLLDCIEAAKSDAFLVAFAKEKIGIIEADKLGQLIMAFREFREAKN